MQHPPSPIHEQTLSTFATKTDTSRHYNMWSELVAFNGQVISSDSDVQLRWYPDFSCVDTLNTNCEVISSVFDNNYLRFDLMKSFCYFLLRYMFLDDQKTGGGLTKSDITFVLFGIFR